jgi:hypothetical protein
MTNRYDTIVRCSKDHLFTTIWVPLASLKAIRLGTRRYQRCPVGRHWTWVRRVDPEQLSLAEREAATAVHDVHVF